LLVNSVDRCHSADPATLSARHEDELSDPDEDLQTRQTRRTRPPLSQKKGRVLAAFGGGLAGAGAFGVIMLTRARIKAYNGAGAARQSGDDSPETEGSNNAQDGEGLQDGNLPSLHQPGVSRLLVSLVLINMSSIGYICFSYPSSLCTQLETHFRGPVSRSKVICVSVHNPRPHVYCVTPPLAINQCVIAINKLL
jgi:hypothetical protein